ncbi:MAG: FISUMP domain-containing protein, partial [Candidatus Saccharibacteria bacterium]|nr:FISUMP domain-containing protein [Candidatus Saccharibacteria bacterium]
GYYKLQDMDSSICAAVDVDDNQLQVIDTRDNKVYWIAKLRDGHCWMTQNLDLDLDSTVTYTHDNTDLGWGSDTATQSWTPDKSTIKANASGTFTGWVNNGTWQYSADPGDWYYAGYDGTTLLPSADTNYLTITPDSNGDIVNSSNSKVYFSNNPSRVNGGTHEHVGNYYNWSAAVASNDTSSYTTSTYGDITGNPQNSICPAGWRLPTITSASPAYGSAGSANEFARLVYLYNDNSYVTNSSAKLELSPLFFARGGTVNGSSVNSSGNYGYYWSSTVPDSGYAYNLYFRATSVTPMNGNGRNNGFSVRCLAR